jgi:hypothetical protein
LKLKVALNDKKKKTYNIKNKKFKDISGADENK